MRLPRGPICGLALGVLICLLLAFGFGEVMVRLRQSSSKVLLFAALAAWFLAMAVPVLFAIVALYRSLQPRSFADGLRVVLAGYFAVLVAFSALYYAMVFLSDFYDAQDAYNYYSNERRFLGAHLIESVPRRVTSERAFSGMHLRLWNGVEQEYPVYRDPEGGEIPIDLILQSSTTEQERMLRYQPANRLVVWMDCFHFSTVTITTLGYGDIAPQKWYAKLAADLEVLLGIAFVSVSLGKIIGAPVARRM